MIPDQTNHFIRHWSIHLSSTKNVKKSLHWSYSTARVYVNRKTRIKRAKNRMQLRIKKVVRVKKSHVRARLWDISLISLYVVALLFFYCWRFIILNNRLQFNSSKISQANFLFAIATRTDLPNMHHQCDFVIRIYKWFTIFQRNSFIKIAISHFVYRNIRRNGLGICSK